MIFEDQYGIGDVVDLGDAIGSVEAVTLRVTRLRDINGTVWYVRNGEILRVGNMSQNWARTVLDISVAYGEDLDRVRTVLAEVCHELWESEDFGHDILEEPEVWGVQDLERRRDPRPGRAEDRAPGAVGDRTRAAASDQGPLRRRGDRDPVPAAGGLAPQRARAARAGAGDAPGVTRRDEGGPVGTGPPSRTLARRSGQRGVHRDLGAGSAFDTGQFSLAPSACSRKSSALMPST